MRPLSGNALTEALSGFLLEYSEDDLYHLLDEKLKSGNHEIKFSLERFHLYDKSGNVKGVYDNEVFQYLTTAFDMFVLGGVPYIYTDGVYLADESGARLKTMIRKLIFPQFVKSTTIKRIYDLFIGAAELQVSYEDLNSYPQSWINFQNGFYDPVTRQMIPHNPSYRATVQIPHKFDPDARTEGQALEEWLRFAIPDGDDREMLLEYAGLCLTRDVRQQKFLILVGSGGSGKSTLIRLLETVLGEDNLSHVSLRELSQRFASVGLLGKLLNSCADLEISALEDTSVIKKILGEDSLRGEFKGKDAISFKSYAKMIFSTNELPLVLSERSNGFFRRVMVLTMDQKPEKARSDFLDVLQGEADYFLRLCVSALVRMYAAGKIHESPASIEAVKTLRNDSDSVQAFLSANIDKSEEGRIKKKDLYTGYEQFCRDADRQSLTKSNFFRSMKAKGFSEIKTGGVECYKGIFWKENLPFFSPEITLTDWSGLPDSSNPFTQGWKREKSGRI